MSNQLITESNERVKSFFLSLDMALIVIRAFVFVTKTDVERREFLYRRRIVEEAKNQPEESSGLPQ